MDEVRKATPEELKDHLEAFVQAFVEPARRERWSLFISQYLSGKSSKAAKELHKIPLDERRATWLEGSERMYDSYDELVGDRLGLFITFETEPVWLPVSDAAVRSDWECKDAIFSVASGKLAIYFNHDKATAVLRGI